MGFGKAIRRLLKKPDAVLPSADPLASAAERVAVEVEEVAPRLAQAAAGAAAHSARAAPERPRVRKLWPGGEVPYTVTPTLKKKKRVKEAIAYLERKSGLHFVER